MIRSAFLALALALAATAQLAHAQGELPVVVPGAVHTAAVALPGGGPPPLSFIVHASDGVRTFGATEGEIEDGAAALSLTFSVGRMFAAGEATIARVALSRADGTADTLLVSVVVAPRRQLEVSLHGGEYTILPGGSATVGYTVRNRGNVEEVVRLGTELDAEWRVLGLGEPVTLAAGAELTAALQVHASPRVAPGVPRVLRVTASGTGQTASAEAQLLVSRGGVAGEWAELPTSVFLGGSSSGAGPESLAVSLNVGGQVAPETSVSLSMQRNPGSAPPAIFSGYMMGSTFHLGLQRPSWSAGAGEVAMYGQGLLSGASQGYGVHLRGAGGSRTGELLLALPRPLHGQPFSASDGHVARLRSTASLGPGTVSLGVRSDEARHGWSGTQRSTSLGYDARIGSRQQVSAEGALLGYESGRGGFVLAPASEAAYWLRTEPLSITARVREVWTEEPGPGLSSDERYLAARARLAGSYHALGSYSSFAVPFGALGARFRSSGGSGGLGWYRAGVRAEVVSHLRTASEPAGDAEIGHRSLTGSLLMPIRAFTAEAQVERNRRSLGAESFSSARARGVLRWNGDAGWAQGGVSYGVTESGRAEAWSDMSGSIQLRSLELRGGTAAALLGGSWQATSFWSGIATDVPGRLTLALGLDYLPWMVDGSPWRLSLGVRRRLSIPLPVAARGEAQQGILFEDLNGNGRRDPGEPGLPGIRILIEGEAVQTGPAGAFRWPRNAPGAAPVLDVEPERLMIAPRQIGSGSRDVAAVRPAVLKLLMTLEAVTVGTTSTNGLPAAMARATLTDASGRARSGVADESGRVTFTGLLPGVYRLSATGPETVFGDAGSRQIEIRLDPGQTLELQAAVPPTSRPIRMSRAGGEG